MSHSCHLVFFGLLALGPADAFYLPGVAPRDYLPGERVDLKVNKLSSTKTQLVRCLPAAPARSTPASRRRWEAGVGPPSSSAAPRTRAHRPILL